MFNLKEKDRFFVVVHFELACTYWPSVSYSTFLSPQTSRFSLFLPREQLATYLCIQDAIFLNYLFIFEHQNLPQTTPADSATNSFTFPTGNQFSLTVPTICLSKSPAELKHLKDFLNSELQFSRCGSVGVLL